ncbi:Sucrose transport protein SUT2 [Acorus gramineus]|uniref:Sucrose transport protein SUT2 n=1 Tax=Acorus gramineus TaxID=55184 RepID=A0AAV9AVL2_ACOGR|nr:Sucrose transport protein SUT2 [Acorus gramineus]
MTIPGRHSTRGRRPPSASASASVATTTRVPLRKLFRVASVACGIQFGWALQLSLLTPYVQELGIPHAWASLIWLCGPLSGLIVQPLSGHLSDRCTSPFGRRRPFIAAGSVSVAIAVLIIGNSADIGHALGDDPQAPKRTRAVVIFVLGFWLLDVANNVTQAPCRALLADLTGKDHRRTRIANAYYSMFMAFGNVLGFAAGSYSSWYTIFPFTVTSSCSINCANLKSAFILDVILLIITSCVSISSAQELPLSTGNGIMHSAEETQQQLNNEQEAFFFELFGSFRYLSMPVWIILIVTAFTWIGWFPFLLFDTDWMGREIYRGKPNVGKNYHTGVRMGALGLMLNSIVLGLTSVGIEKLCRKWGAGFLWGISNIFMSLCFVAMLVISFVSKNLQFPRDGLPPDGIVVPALIVFAVLGAPLAVTYSVPYAMVSTRAESLGLGQGLAMGVLNLAIVIPQVIVSVGSGPWDQLFGGGNSPAFAVAAAAAFVSGLVAILALPQSPPIKTRPHH